MAGERTEAIREDARQMRESVRRENLEQKLEHAVEERPEARSYLELRPILIAVAIAAVLALIAFLLIGPRFAALVLVLSFGLAWVALSRRHHEQRRPTKDLKADGDAAAGSDEQ